MNALYKRTADSPEQQAILAPLFAQEYVPGTGEKGDVTFKIFKNPEKLQNRPPRPTDYIPYSELYRAAYHAMNQLYQGVTGIKSPTIFKDALQAARPQVLGGLGQKPTDVVNSQMAANKITDPAPAEATPWHTKLDNAMPPAPTASPEPTPVPAPQVNPEGEIQPPVTPQAPNAQPEPTAPGQPVPLNKPDATQMAAAEAYYQQELRRDPAVAPYRDEIIKNYLAMGRNLESPHWGGPTEPAAPQATPTPQAPPEPIQAPTPAAPPAAQATPAATPGAAIQMGKGPMSPVLFAKVNPNDPDAVNYITNTYNQVNQRQPDPAKAKAELEQTFGIQSFPTLAQFTNYATQSGLTYKILNPEDLKVANQQPQRQAPNRAVPQPRAAKAAPMQSMQNIANELRNALSQAAAADSVTWKQRLAQVVQNPQAQAVINAASDEQVNQLVEAVTQELHPSKDNTHTYGRLLGDFLRAQPQIMQAITKLAQEIGRTTVSEGVMDTLGYGLGKVAGGIVGGVKNLASGAAQGYKSTQGQPQQAQQPQGDAGLGKGVWGDALRNWKTTAAKDAEDIDPAFHFIESLPPGIKEPIYLLARIYGVGQTIKQMIQRGHPWVAKFLSPQAQPQQQAEAPKVKAKPKKAKQEAAPAQQAAQQPAPQAEAGAVKAESIDRMSKFMKIESAEQYNRGLKPIDPSKLEVPGYTGIDKDLFVVKYNTLKEMLDRAKRGEVTNEELAEVNHIKKIRHYNGDAGVLDYIASHVGDPDGDDTDPTPGLPQTFLYEGRLRIPRKPLVEDFKQNKGFDRALDNVLNEGWSVSQNSELREENALDVLMIVKEELAKIDCFLFSVPTFRFNLNGFDVSNIEIKTNDPRKVIEKLQKEIPEVRYDFYNNPSVYAYIAIAKSVGDRVRQELGLDIGHYDLQGKDRSSPGISIRKPKLEMPLPPPEAQGMGAGAPPPPAPDMLGQTPPAPPQPGAEAGMGAAPPAPGAPPPTSGVPDLFGGQQEVQETEAPAPGATPPNPLGI
jgi:hypothetical protein